MPARSDPVRVVLQIVIYVVLYVVTAFVFGPLLYWIGGYIAGVTATGLLAAALSNILCMRIYEQRGLRDIGLHWNRCSALNSVLGLLGGVGAACLVLSGPLLAGAARLTPINGDAATPGSALFLSVLLLFGAAGEEILFRGFGFQVLVRAWGPAMIYPVGVIFALLHTANPSASILGIANTAGFGILFGYAFLRSRDIWLPIGLHFGWNVTLPLFGVNVSGIKMRMTGYAMEWTAGSLWSGGDYGPEASILTSGMMILLFFFLWKAPIRRQSPALLRNPPAENVSCESGPQS